MKRAQSESLQSSNIKKMNTSEKQNLINYVFDPPSLKNIALVNIAVKLFSCEAVSISDAISTFGSFQSIGDSTAKKYEDIYIFRHHYDNSLPQSLTSQVYGIVHPIREQWTRWITSNDGMVYGKYCDLKKLYEKKGLTYWTMEGKLDEVKLLKDIFEEIKVTNNKFIDCATLYKTACKYCMEEYISEFWSKLPKEDRRIHYYAHYPDLHVVAYWTASLNNELPRLMDFWADDISEIYDRNCSISEYMMCSFIQSRNWIAFKFFWDHKCTGAEKRINIKKWISLASRNYSYNSSSFKDFSYFDMHFDSCVDIMFFLLTHLDSFSEQKKIFETYPNVLPLLYFHWPLRRYFLPTIEVMLDSLHEDIYVAVMLATSTLFSRIETFRQIWDISPSNLKTSFLSYLKHDATIIMRLMYGKHDTTIDSILRNVTVDNKRQFFCRLVQDDMFFELLTFRPLSSNSAIDIDTLVSRNLSENDLHSFKRDVMRRHGRRLINKCVEVRYIKFLNIFWNWAFPSLEECDKIKDKYINLEDAYLLLIREEFEYRISNVNEFLNWCFETEKEINVFKRSVVRKDNFEKCRVLIRGFSEKGTAGWELFKKFQKFSLNSSDEIINFKNVFKEFVDQDESFAGKNDEFNYLFKNWCLDSTSNEVESLLSSKPVCIL